jgi:2-polyprenyl-6-hydroxyphenyl methylase/3-demethylubiquinone-9 3-methyltransferase
MTEEISTEYAYAEATPSHTNGYLWEPIQRELEHHIPSGARVFDLGCGNGALARRLKGLGYSVTGVDPSESGIAIARKADTDLRLEVGNAYEDLAARYGRFPALVSLEVVEHVYYPRKFAKCVHDLLEPGGIALISTPYHGYMKNLALALSGKMDWHYTALWDHGHIKFWSVKTLTDLFTEQALIRTRVRRVGRIPVLAKSMILVFKKPS